MEALTTLGFQEYVPDVKAVHKEYKEQASVSSLFVTSVPNYLITNRNIVNVVRVSLIDWVFQKRS